MAGSLLLGLDLGTSGVRAGLFAPEDGRPVKVAKAPCRTDAPRPGWAETPPERWRRAAFRALRELGPRARDAAAVGVSVLFPALTPMDAKGRALRPAILYCDQRSAPEVQALGARRERIERRIGNRLAPGTCALTSLLWLRKHEPETYRETAVFGLANTFLAHALTGVFATDPSCAGLSGLVETGRENTWSEPVARLAGVGVDRWAPIRPSASVVGEVTRRASRATGLPAGTPVAIGGGDAPVAAFGGGALDAGDAFCILGSSDNVIRLSASAWADPRSCNVPHCVEGRWASIATMTCGGAAIEWFAKAFVGPKAGAANVERLALRSRPGAGGVCFLPYLRGERTPVWDAKARGVFFGMTSSTTLADMARAVMEGVAHAFRQIMGDAPARLIAAGGGASGELIMKLRASAVNRPIRVLDFQDTSTLGAALLAGIGSGLYPSPRRALDATRSLRKTKVVRPDKALAAEMARAFETYGRLYPALRDVFGLAR